MLHITKNYALQILCGEPHKICNEEGKLEGLPLNRALRDEDGDIYRFLKLEMLQRQFLKGAVS